MIRLSCLHTFLCWVLQTVQMLETDMTLWSPTSKITNTVIQGVHLDLRKGVLNGLNNQIIAGKLEIEKWNFLISD